VEKIRTIARIAAAAFGVFAALLFVQFIAQSVADRSQTLVVLRTLGASKSETAKIFILQALITGGAVFGAALLFGGAGCIALNKFFAAVIGTKLTVVTFGAATIFTLLLSVIALSVIGALVPVLHATRTDKLIINE
jgi:ABC-type antimicrobial peptide transport system permease subunit